jgi:hypothetical protein
LACSGERRVGEAKAPSRLVERFRFNSVAARWVIQTGNPGTLVRCSNETAGERFCIGKTGELWLDAAPKATLLNQWAPELLSDVWQTDEVVRLLGVSGTVYELDATHRRIARAFTPPRRWVKTVRARNRLLALDDQGTLHQSDDAGASWQPQLAVSRVFDLASDRAGRVALLTFPEQVYSSNDLGRFFERLPRQPDGATALGNDLDGQIRLYSLLREPVRLLPELSMEPSGAEDRRLRYPIAEYLSASDFVDGRVAEGQGEPLVLRKTDSGWVSYRGRIGEPLEGPWPVELLDCVSLRLIAVQNGTLAVCSNEPRAERSSRLTLWESRDEARHFEPVSAGFSGAIADLVGIGYGRSNDFLLSGICVDDVETRKNVKGDGAVRQKRARAADCLAKTVYRVSLETQGKANPSRVARFEPLRLAPLLGPAEAMAQTESRSRLAIAAVTAKNRQPTLFVVRDGEERFSTVPLTLSHSGETRRGTSERVRRFLTSPREDPQPKIVSMALAEDGTVTLVTKLGDRPTLVTLEADGTPRAVANAPLGTSQLGASTEGALALSFTDARLYESTDQGAEFLPIATINKTKICASSSCAVVCRGRDCVIGDGVSRLGFGPGPELLAPFEIPVEKKQTSERTKGGYECQLAPSGWQALKGSGPFPNALTAGFSKTLFYWLGSDPKSQNLTLARLNRGDGAVASESVFERLSSSSWATAPWRGPVGWVAARVEQVGAPSDSIGWVDFRWENFSEARTFKKRVRFTEPLGALVSQASFGTVFSPAALSILDSSLVVELGRAKSKNTVDAYLLSESGNGRKLSFPPWPVVDDRELDYLLSSGKITRVALDRSGAVVLTAREGESQPQAMTVMPPPLPGSKERATFGYLGQTSGVFVPTVPFGFLPLADEIAQTTVSSSLRPLPSERNLAPCHQEQRSPRSRYLTPDAGGRGFPLRIDPGDGSALWLLSGRSVLYQKDGSACWELAEASDESRQYSALLFGETPEDSWLFRQSGESDSVPSLLYARLRCHRNEALDMPAESVQK